MLFDKAAPKSTAASSTLMMIPLNIQKTVEFSITTPELFPTSFIDSFMNRFFFSRHLSHKLGEQNRNYAEVFTQGLICQGHRSLRAERFFN